MRDEAEAEKRLTVRPERLLAGPRASAIRKRSVAEAVQHPATLLPLATAALSATYLVLVAPVIGGAAVAIPLGVISFLGAAASFGFRYPKEYSRASRASWVLLQQTQTEREQAQLIQEQKRLRGAFASIGATEGLSVLADLWDEYELLGPALGHRESDLLSMPAIAGLAGETFRHGLGVLSDALVLMREAHGPGRERLVREVAGLEKEVEAMKGDATQSERLKIKEETLTSHGQLLRKLDDLRLRADRLVHQARRCEASLHSTRLELAEIRTGSSESGVDSLIETLQRTLSQVKEVQAEVKRLGY